MLLEGQIFDNTYRLVRLIGEGGMGAVYEATHARLAGRYAIKVLLPTLWEDPEALARFHREARVTSLLQHPNVVEVIDYNTAADGTEYLVMEYLAGESLAQRLFREGAMPLEAGVGIVEQIAAGLAAAHAHGIVHRDLKPDNVFLVPVEGREAESVKILDFGISKVQGASWGLQAPEGALCGTPQYMSPEQVEGRTADVDAATDQFALAVLAYELLTGRNPFQGDTVGAIFSQVLSGVPAPTGVGRDVDSVLCRGLAKSNRRRFPSVTDFSDALRAAATGRADESQRLATMAYITPSRRSRFGLALVVAAAGLSVSFVGVGAANRRNEIPTSLLTSAPSRIEAPPARNVALPVQEEIESTAETAAETVHPVIVPLPAASRADAHHRSLLVVRVARGGRSSPVREGSLSAPSRPRLAATPSPFDNDATLPLDESVGDAR